MMEILRNLARRKLRSTLTISGIVIGIFALTTMGALSEHFNALLDGGVRYFGSNVQVGPPVGQTAALLPLSVMDQIRQVPGVRAVAPNYEVQAMPGGRGVQFGPGDQIVNEDPATWGLSALPLTISGGRNLDTSGRGEVLLGVTIAADLRARVGDVIDLPVPPADAPPSFATHPFTVVGILDRTGTAPDTFAYVDDADARMLLAGTLPAGLRRAIDVDGVAPGFTVYGPAGASISDLDALARRINAAVPAIKATEPSQPVNAFRSFNATFGAVVTGAAFLAVVIGGLSVVNTMVMAVSERVREIGLKKAVGARTGRIVREYLTEATVIGLLGGIGGYALGLLVTTLLDHSSQSLDIFLVTPKLTATCIGFAAGLGALAGLAPALRAARLDPVTALRISN
jgi:putative ABC transport system permease protein